MPYLFDENEQALQLAPAPHNSLVTTHPLNNTTHDNIMKQRRKMRPKRMVLIVSVFIASVIIITDQVHLVYNVSHQTTSTTVASKIGDLDLDDDELDIPQNSLLSTEDVLSWNPDDIVRWYADPATKSPESNAIENKIAYETVKNTTNSIVSRMLPWSLPRLPPIQKTSSEFMAELITFKHSINISSPWETSSHLPYPIINLGLPKSGTTTTAHYFKCGKLVSAHTNQPFTNTRIGDCMRDNFLAGRSPFTQCQRHNRTKQIVQFWSDIGIPKPCFYSSLHDGGLDHIAEHYPDATILMMRRNATSWYQSIKKWGGGALLNKWKKICGFSGPNRTTTQKGWEDFYMAHTEKVREFARMHPSMTYVEVELDETAPLLMELYSGISKECFKDCHPGKPKGNVTMKGYNRCQPIIQLPSNDKDKSTKPEKLPWSLPRLPPIQKTSSEFMAELITFKHSINISSPWETSSHLPYPIINLGLPKSGTTTTKNYFSCGNLVSAHTNQPYKSLRIGDCMRDNFLAGRSPFTQCQRHHRTKQIVQFWSDIGIPKPCFYSSLHDGGLDHIAEHYPDATILMMRRNATSWYQSIKKWGGGTLLNKWKSECGFSGPNGTTTQKGWEDFYMAHTEKVREFARTHPFMTYVEVELDETAPLLMEHYSGISKECFKDCHPGVQHNACQLIIESPQDSEDDDEDDDEDIDENDDDDDDGEDRDENDEA